MNDKEFTQGKEEIFSKTLRAGRRTYFFDVRATKADDYYLTVTESKKFTEDDGSFRYKKHKIYLYKEDFEGFQDCLNQATDFIFKNRGEEVISDRHQADYNSEGLEMAVSEELVIESADNFSNVVFEDL